MNIQTIKPRAALSRYIDCYYFICTSDPDFQSVHYSFPHTFNAVSIYKSATCHSDNAGISVLAGGGADHLTILQGKRQYPIRVTLAGPIDRISILFRPLGLNQFMGGPLSRAMAYPANEFHLWNRQNGYRDGLTECFSKQDNQQRIDALEGFLLSCLEPVAYPKMDLALALLGDMEGNYPIETIAHRIGMPLRTFNRQFCQVIGISPVAYKGIVRFRHSIADRFFGPQFQRLTDIGYNNNYYDQSYFGRMYKKLTGQNPAAFFREVEKLGDDRLVFRFVKS